MFTRSGTSRAPWHQPPPLPSSTQGMPERCAGPAGYGDSASPPSPRPWSLWRRGPAGATTARAPARRPGPCSGPGLHDAWTYACRRATGRPARRPTPVFSWLLRFIWTGRGGSHSPSWLRWISRHTRRSITHRAQCSARLVRSVCRLIPRPGIGPSERNVTDSLDDFPDGREANHAVPAPWPEHRAAWRPRPAGHKRRGPGCSPAQRPPPRRQRGRCGKFLIASYVLPINSQVGGGHRRLDSTTCPDAPVGGPRTGASSGPMPHGSDGAVNL